MVKLIFFLQAFGFENFKDLKISTFGFILNKWVLISSIITAGGINVLNSKCPFFGLQYRFFIAYVGLVLFEWLTGVLASFHRGEKHESRKLGRMLLKVFIYTLLIALLHQLTFIELFGFTNVSQMFNPFTWLYWMMLVVIVWQLWVSVLENLDDLGFRFAKIALKLINKTFENKLKINEDVAEQIKNDKS